MDVEAIARSLSRAQREMVLLDRINGLADGTKTLPDAWGLEEKQLVEREAFVFGFYYTPTPLGLAVRAYLEGEG